MMRSRSRYPFRLLHLSRNRFVAAITSIVQLLPYAQRCGAFIMVGGVVKQTKRCLPSTMPLFNKRFKISQDFAKPEKEDSLNEFLWDGVSVEGAHDEEFEHESDEDDAFIPSFSFMSMTNSVPSVLEKTPSFDSKRFVVQTDSLAVDEDEQHSETILSDVGGDPFFTEDEWSWDGIPIEGAHDEEFEPGSGEIENDEFAPSAGFLIAANSIAPSIFDRSGFDPFVNAGKLHQRNTDKSDGSFSQEDLLDVGGDPFFLDEADRLDIVVSQQQMKLDQLHDFEWDGTVNEDAHLDFD